MKKIPTLYKRDWATIRKDVIPEVSEGCEWVIAGHGVATRKLDGTCCMVRGGKLYKRLETTKKPPVDFEEVDYDVETGKRVGWRPVGDGPEDKWHREAFGVFWAPCLRNGTYELIGPKVQGNPEKATKHTLVRHDNDVLVLWEVPTDFASLRAWFVGKDIEGVVWHHPDGRMAKIKARDFGLTRADSATE